MRRRMMFTPSGPLANAVNDFRSRSRKTSGVLAAASEVLRLRLQPSAAVCSDADRSRRCPLVRQALLATGVLALVLQAAPALADLVEFLSGSKVEGQIVSKDEKYVTFRATIGSRTYVRKYPLDRIHALTVDGQREVVHQKPAAGATATSPPGATPPGDGQRTRTQVDALIERLGRTPPEWWDSVPLDYPKTLDLSWPQPPPQGWNNRKNVGQYVWDVINTNPENWRGGVRFMHYLLRVHQRNPSARRRAMKELGRMYHDLLQDYARAAFWWRQAGVGRTDRTRAGVHLGECYWKLGNKQMALELLKQLPPTFAMIKLWADLGDTHSALRMADANLNAAGADLACLYAGDACRIAGQYRQALQYYEKLLAMPAAGQAGQRIQRNQQRARANVEAIRLYDTLDLRRVPDGTYRSSSLGYEAQVYVEVGVRGGRIESVRVTDHREKQYYSSLTDTPRKIIEKQGLKGIDTTSSATITSEAIINATAKALARGMQ